MNNLKNDHELILSMPFKVTSADSDMNARLRVGTLVNQLIQAAINSADSLEFGFSDIRRHKLFWVLSRLSIEIYSSLHWNQSGEVETWPKDVQKILYIRDFVVRDQQQSVVAKATSGWLCVDADTKQARSIDGLNASLFNQLKAKHALTCLPEKLFPVKDGDLTEIKTSYFDIDINGHVTSTRYVDWMLDCFSVEFHQQNYPKRISINYLNEIRLGETIALTKKQTDEKTFVFEGINKNREIVAFRGKLEF